MATVYRRVGVRESVRRRHHGPFVSLHQRDKLRNAGLSAPKGPADRLIRFLLNAIEVASRGKGKSVDVRLGDRTVRELRRNKPAVIRAAVAHKGEVGNGRRSKEQAAR